MLLSTLIIRREGEIVGVDVFVRGEVGEEEASFSPNPLLVWVVCFL